MPLFALALALGAFGFYMALTEAPDSGEEISADGPIETFEPLEVSDDVVDGSAVGVRLSHREAEPREILLSLSQTTRRQDEAGGERVLGSRLEITLDETVEAASSEDLDQIDDERREDVWAVTRQYKKARAEVLGVDEAPVGEGITSQVEDLVRGSITRSFVVENGQPVGFQWREVPNPQARRTLYLVRDGHAFLTPRFFAGAVNAGDTWEYSQPIHVEEPDLGLSVTGSFDVHNDFVGTLTHQDRRLGVIRQQFEMLTEGDATDADAEFGFRVEGAGRGLMLVEIETGRAFAADITLERTLSIERDGQPDSHTSEIAVGLRPADGLSLPELREQQDEDGHELEASKDHAEAE